MVSPQSFIFFSDTLFPTYYRRRPVGREMQSLGLVRTNTSTIITGLYRTSRNSTLRRPIMRCAENKISSSDSSNISPFTVGAMLYTA